MVTDKYAETALMPTIDGYELIAVPAISIPMRLWWLSFCDADLPAGSQSLGVCIVEGFDIGWAAAEAHRLGCNPGGEVWGVEFPVEKEDWARERYPIGKLMSRADIEQIDGEPCVTVAELGGE